MISETECDVMNLKYNYCTVPKEGQIEWSRKKGLRNASINLTTALYQKRSKLYDLGNRVLCNEFTNITTALYKMRGKFYDLGNMVFCNGFTNVGYNGL